MTMSSLSIILVNRLVLNLRERAVEQLPTTVETAGRFQAALPVPRQLLSMTSVRNPSFVRQNRSIGETVSVGTTAEFHRSADDAIRYMPPLVESVAGSFCHGKEIAAPTQPHVRRHTLPSSSRKGVRLEFVCFIYATGRPSALFDPNSDTESDSGTDSDDASSFSYSFRHPSLYIPPNPNIYLESIFPLLLASARPPLLRSTVGIHDIAYDKCAAVAAYFTIDGRTTVSEVLAQYTGPTISETHHHSDGDDSKWDRIAICISLEFYAPRRTLIALSCAHAPFGCWTLHRAGRRRMMGQ
jgi:hypothetical protein